MQVSVGVCVSDVNIYRAAQDQWFSEKEEKIAEDPKLETYFHACHARWRKAILNICSRYCAVGNISIYWGEKLEGKLTWYMGPCFPSAKPVFADLTIS